MPPIAMPAPVLAELLAMTGTKPAAKIAARLTDVTVNDAYARALELGAG